ncbi:hypothetical protein [Fluviispira sanaruensis]|uniref:Uncharacterized protein n=1 Tax=Fluviispira sanaruensis TaxID=2493639 RepID=A0A4P2VJB0_FLUSA|nr:hypothetical protein [Fluviispira sanaruensis]BBH52761.1 hypothetical protein JCM31447_12040 [Fluviispira sanaruensis]
MYKKNILLFVCLFIPIYSYPDEFNKDYNSNNKAEIDNLESSESVFNKLKFENGEIIVSDNSIDEHNASASPKEKEDINKNIQ